MAVIRFFAAARDAAGLARDDIEGATLDDVLRTACERYGPGFAATLETCSVWVNGDEAPRSTPIGATDEVAVLPPVSGGCR